jgi:cell division protein FtsI (penicillin-binding protein 3)
MNVKKDILWRIYAIFFGMCILGAAILFSAFRLIVNDGEKFQKKEANQNTQIRPIAAMRGNIYACDGSVLATSIPIYDVYWDLKADGLKPDTFNKYIDSVCINLSLLYKDKSANEYEQIFRNARAKNQRHFLIRNKVAFEEMMLMKKWPLFKWGKNRGGIIVEEDVKRKLPLGNMALRTIGYKIEGVNPVGIEGYYDSLLAGTKGFRLEQKAPGGGWIPVDEDDQLDARNGNDIITNIDVNFQDVAQTALLNTLVNNDAESGCTILMEVATGKIKAIANLTRKSEGVYIEDFNYAIADASEPGSTFKLISYMALIEDNFITINDTLNITNGKFSYYGNLIEDSHAPAKNMVTVKEAFEQSSNVAISRLVVKHYAKNSKPFFDKIYQTGINKVAFEEMMLMKKWPLFKWGKNRGGIIVEEDVKRK